MDLIVDAIGNFLLMQYPGLGIIFAVLGSLLALASAIDLIIPKEIDNDLITDFFSKPGIKNLVKFLARFSVLRNRKEGEK